MIKKILFISNHASFFFSHRYNIFKEARKRNINFKLIIGEAASKIMEKIAFENFKKDNIDFTKYNFSKYYPEYERKYIFRVICPEQDIRKLSVNQKAFLKNQEIEIKPYLSSALDYYKDSRALIVPSSYGEGLSGVVLEACYLGIPILASRSRGIQEYFPHDYKYFIKSYNPFSMSQQLAEMINDDKYFNEIRELIKLNIKNNYSTEKAIDEFNSKIFNK